jgi:hypothetical protein
MIPGTRGKILGVLAETTAQLNLTTISRLAGVSLAQASRVLPELVHLGLVERVEAPPSALFRLMDENIVGRLVRSMTDLRYLALRAIGVLYLCPARSRPATFRTSFRTPQFAAQAAGQQTVRPVERSVLSLRCSPGQAAHCSEAAADPKGAKVTVLGVAPAGRTKTSTMRSWAPTARAVGIPVSGVDITSGA